jgi:hypothetical protein
MIERPEDHGLIVSPTKEVVHRVRVTPLMLREMPDGHLLMLSELGERARIAVAEGRVGRVRTWEELDGSTIFEWTEIVSVLHG